MCDGDGIDDANTDAAAEGAGDDDDAEGDDYGEK